MVKESQSLLISISQSSGSFFLVADTEISSDYIGILKRFLIIRYIYPLKEYSRPAQRMLLFIKDAFSLTNIYKYDDNFARISSTSVFVFLHLWCIFFQDLLSIANVAEQHEVWDFLSVSSKVLVMFCTDVRYKSLNMHFKSCWFAFTKDYLFFLRRY